MYMLGSYGGDLLYRTKKIDALYRRTVKVINQHANAQDNDWRDCYLIFGAKESEWNEYSQDIRKTIKILWVQGFYYWSIAGFDEITANYFYAKERIKK